jgi:hypothetical protein
VIVKKDKTHARRPSDDCNSVGLNGSYAIARRDKLELGAEAGEAIHLICGKKPGCVGTASNR